MLPPLAAGIAAGSVGREVLSIEDPDSGSVVTLPLVIARGGEEGPTLCLVSGQHGTDVGGTAALHLLFRQLDPRELKGTVIAAPVANPLAARSKQRCFPTEAPLRTECPHDMSAVWPGDAGGTLAERLAAVLWEACIESCHAVVDFQSQPAQLGPMAIVRVTSDASVAAAQAFGAPHIQITREAHAAYLRDVAARQGKAALEVRLPAPGLVDPGSVRLALNGIRNLLVHLQMLDRAVRPAETALVPAEAEEHLWRAPTDGLVLAHMDPGSIVQEGKLIAEVIGLRDFAIVAEAVAPFRGVVTMLGCPSTGPMASDTDVVNRGELYARMARCDA